MGWLMVPWVVRACTCGPSSSEIVGPLAGGGLASPLACICGGP